MLEAQNLSYGFGERFLFSSLSFSLEKGEALSVKGKNGSGKTTLLRMIAGLIRPQLGTLTWEGEMVPALDPQNLLYVGHKLALHSEGRVKDQIKMWKTLYGVSEKSIQEVLKDWGLGEVEERKISHLSRGQQKRLSLSRCGWLQRPLWILDEPHSSLDGEGRDLLDQALCQHREKGGIILLASHENFRGTHEICLS